MASNNAMPADCGGAFIDRKTTPYWWPLALDSQEGRLERPIANDRAASHHALEARFVEAGGAVQRAAVVPHDTLRVGPMYASKCSPVVW